MNFKLLVPSKKLKVEIEKELIIGESAIQAHWRADIFSFQKELNTTSSSNEELRKKRRETKKDLDEQLLIRANMFVDFYQSFGLRIATLNPSKEMRGLLNEMLHFYDKYEYFRKGLDSDFGKLLALREKSDKTISLVPSVFEVEQVGQASIVRPKSHFTNAELFNQAMCWYASKIFFVVRKMINQFN